MGNKNAQINEFNRNQILEKIDVITRACTDTKLRMALEDMRMKITAQPIDSSAQAFECDAKIISYLNAIQGDVMQGGWTVAQLRLEKVQKALVERGQIGGTSSDLLLTRQQKRLKKQQEKRMAKWQKKNSIAEASSSFTVDELYKDDELYEMHLAGLHDSLAREQAKFNEIDAQLKKDPYNQFLISQYQKLQDVIRGLNDRIKIYSDERTRTSYITSLQQASAAHKELIAARPYSNEAAKVIKEEHDAIMQSYADDEILKMRAQEMGTYSSSVGGVGTVVATSGMTMGGVSSIDPIRARQELDQLRRAVSQLEQREADYNQQVKDYGMELAQVDEELKALLTKRDTLSPAQRKVFDGEIEVRRAKHNRIAQIIDRVNQARSEATDKLNLVAIKEQVVQLERICNSDTAIAGIDFEKIALEIRENTEKRNQALDAIGTAVAVSQSIETKTGAMSGTNQTNSTSLDEYGDSKFDDLKRELGMKV